MPLFQVDIQKTSFGYNWTNVYVLRAADLATAHDAAFSVMAIAEQAVHVTTITISKVRTSTLAEGDESFKTVVTALAGTIAVTGNGLPLFNVVKVDIEAEAGRPSRKYYRSGLSGNDVAAGYAWDATHITAIETAIEGMRDDLIAAGVTWVDPDDQVLGEVVVQPQIAMHQLRRGSKRREAEVLSESAPGPSRRRGTVSKRLLALEQQLLALQKAPA